MLKLYHIDVNGQIQLIFHNQYYSDNYIGADKIYSIPDRRYPEQQVQLSEILLNYTIIE